MPSSMAGRNQGREVPGRTWHMSHWGYGLQAQEISWSFQKMTKKRERGKKKELKKKEKRKKKEKTASLHTVSILGKKEFLFFESVIILSLVNRSKRIEFWC